MKYTIEGFSQEYAMTLKKEVVVGKKTVNKKIDCTDLVILRWFVDFYPKMKKIEVDGKQYAWLTHKKLQEDLPLIDISKRAFIDRMQKLVDFDILEYKLLQEGGTFSLYGFGKNYMNLVQSNNTGYDVQLHEGGAIEQHRVVQSNDTGYDVQPANKDKSIIDTSNKDKYIKDINTIVEYLNEKAGTQFKTGTESTQKFIQARMNEGFMINDFKNVIDKKCNDWIGTDYEKYLRPTTLFGTKFEGYLNAPTRKKTKVGTSGIEIKEEVMDEEMKRIFGE